MLNNTKKTNVVDHNSSGLTALLISQRLQLIHIFMCSSSTQVNSNPGKFSFWAYVFVLRLHLRTADLKSAPSLTFAVDLSRLDGCAPTEPTCMLFHSPVYIRWFCNAAEAGTFYSVAFPGAMFKREHHNISFLEHTQSESLKPASLLVPEFRFKSTIWWISLF